MYLCLAVKRIPVPRVPKNWWEQNGVGMEGIQMEAWESEHMEGGWGDTRDRDVDVLSWWEDNVSNITLGTEHNSPLAYALVLENHHLIISTLGELGGRLEIERDSSLNNEILV